MKWLKKGNPIIKEKGVKEIITKRSHYFILEVTERKVFFIIFIKREGPGYQTLVLVKNEK